MKKNIIYSYIEGLATTDQGEGYAHIMRLFLPEFITSLLLYSMPIILDAYFIGSLKSTAMYSTLGATNNLMHFIIKISEAFPVGIAVLVGYYNGRADFKGVGNTLRDAFWTTLVSGALIAGILYAGAPTIYTWYVPPELVPLGVPFLRLRAIGIFCMFIFMAFIGFLRGIKNTRAPMKIFISGAIIFLFLDYVLIYGKYGFPEMGLQGSALASVIQYVFMLFVVIGYMLWNKKNHKYLINLFSIFTEPNDIMRLLSLSWLVMLDKATMALAYIWLLRVMKPMGECGIAAFCLVKDLERFAFLPAIACAQIITCLVSNDIGQGNGQRVKTNIKKVILLASIMVFTILFVISMWPKMFMQYFDKQGNFIDLAATTFPILSIFMFFDLLQIILSGALRGAGNVKTVFFARLSICLGYFVPVSYIIAYYIPIENMTLKFILIYGSFYIGNAIMTVIYVKKFRTNQWIYLND